MCVKNCERFFIRILDNQVVRKSEKRLYSKI